jgi:phosphatidylinositol glycan class T
MAGLTSVSSHFCFRFIDIPGAVRKLLYQPAIDRRRPSVVEMELQIPPMSHMSLRWRYDKVLLRYTEYPPDANRGFDIGYRLH